MKECENKKHPESLVIVGNGFDLNHGYKTDYRSFEENSNDPCLKIFEKYCKKEGIETWYWFEENINIISHNMFQKSMVDFEDSYDHEAEVQKLKETFVGIHNALIKYLRSEISSFELSKKTCIEKYLNNSAITLNFNYTNTVEAYTSNVIYVHGSLQEDDIILGFDQRDFGCLEQFEDMQWAKNFCREALDFRRFLLNNKGYVLNSNKFKEHIDALQKYYVLENTGKGIDFNTIDTTPYFRTIKEFLDMYRAKSGVPDIDYESIMTIVVLGHGIEADREYLTRILKKCTNLNKVVIYYSDKDGDNVYNNKVLFFSPFCKEIEKIDY